jgi:putative ABC transport system substrate-binding protein
MAIHIGKREFIAGLSGAALVWPFAARAQQPAMPVIGFLGSGSLAGNVPFVAAFRQGLSEAGYTEDRNVTIEYRWAEGRYDRFPAMLADLLRRQAAVIVATGGDPSALAAKAATSTTPIVFETGTDPVKLGLVSSLNQPGGNATGISLLNVDLEPKRLQLLIELVPTAATIAFLVNPNNPTAQARAAIMQSAARASDRQLVVLNAGEDGDLDTAFAAVAQQKIGAVLVAGDALFTIRRERLVALAARYRVPASYNQREYILIGGLTSYGASLSEIYHQVGLYAGRILKGEKTVNLPVMQSTKVEFVINQKTAKTLGLTIPLPLLGRADEVIE